MQLDLIRNKQPKRYGDMRILYKVDWLNNMVIPSLN